MLQSPRYRPMAARLQRHAERYERASIIVTSLAESDLRAVLDAHICREFPVVREEKLLGVLTREEAEKSLAEKRRSSASKVARICSAGGLSDARGGTKRRSR